MSVTFLQHTMAWKWVTSARPDGWSKTVVESQVICVYPCQQGDLAAVTWKGWEGERAHAVDMGFLS